VPCERTVERNRATGSVLEQWKGIGQRGQCWNSGKVSGNGVSAGTMERNRAAGSVLEQWKGIGQRGQCWNSGKVSGNGVSAGQKRSTKTCICLAVSSNVNSQHNHVCVRNAGMQFAKFLYVTVQCGGWGQDRRARNFQGTNL
jgi:hypothetical protein